MSYASCMLPLLRQLQADAALIDLRLERGDARGYIEALSDELLLLAVATSNVTMGGFTVIRVEDIELIRWNEECHRAWQAALMYDGVSLRRSEPISLDSWVSAIGDIATQERLLTFHIDEPDAVFIGTGVSLVGELVVADNVTIEGTIDGRFALSVDRVRRIDFGGPYERGLTRMLDIGKH